MRRMKRVTSMVAIATMWVANAGLSGCSTSGRSNGTGDPNGQVDDAGIGAVLDAFFETDPPLQMCTFDGKPVPAPPDPGGTADCPADKNRQGCPCPAEGMQ